MKLEVKNFPTLEKEMEQEIYNSVYENACRLAEKFFTESNELGYGQTATIYNTTNESNICLKRLKQGELSKYPFMNNLEEEARFLERAHNLVLDEDCVDIPLPIVVINTQRKEFIEKKNRKGEMVRVPQTVQECVLAMERVNGPSLEDIFDPKEERFRKEAPEGINWEIFFERLEAFIIKMNNLGIHHRDLHKGNIMIDEVTHHPVIIDFGFSRKKHFDDEDIYIENTHPEYTAKFTSDIDNVHLIKKEVLNIDNNL